MGFKDYWKEFTHAVNGCAWAVVINVTELSSEVASSIKHAPAKLIRYTQDSWDFYKGNKVVLQQEIISGMTTAILQIPESVAFSFVAGLDPIIGLRASVIMCLVCGLTGAQPATVNGAAGAMAVVLKDLSGSGGRWVDRPKNEIETLVFMTVIMTGVVQVLFGLLGIARLARLIPFTSLIGFVNALAIIIMMTQLDSLKYCPDGDYEVCMRKNSLEWLPSDEGETWISAFELVAAAGIVVLFSKMKRVTKYIPAALFALVVVSGFEHGINRPLLKMESRTVGETSSISGNFVAPQIPTMPSNPDWEYVLLYAFILGLIGSIESIMTAQAVSELLQTPLDSYASTQETISQGLGNFLSGLLGSMGGDGMIGQSTVNVMNGAKGRLSTASAGVFLAIIVLSISFVIEVIPMSCLSGVIIVIVFKTFHWPSFLLIFQLTWPDSVGIILVTILGVTTNLAIAVIAGAIFRALVHVYNASEMLHITTETMIDPGLGNGGERDAQINKPQSLKKYIVHGPLFFGSATTFRTYFTPAQDPSITIIDFTHSTISDFSGVTALRGVCRRYKSVNKTIVVRGLCSSSNINVQRDYKLRSFVDARAEAEIIAAHEADMISHGDYQMQVLQPVGEINHPGETPCIEDIAHDLERDGVLVEYTERNLDSSQKLE